jgi:hypothetical protein
MPMTDVPPNSGNWVTYIPRLSKLKNKAILTDLICFPASVTYRHKTGINVLYGHGGAKWVDRKVLEEAPLRQWRFIAYDSFRSDYNIAFLRSVSGVERDGVWIALDQQ